jgi:hypothetical protein
MFDRAVARFGCGPAALRAPSVARLWQEAAQRLTAKSTQDAIDNFVLAASAAAQKDLTVLFSKDWRWPVSETARKAAAQWARPPRTSACRETDGGQVITARLGRK